MRATNSYAIRPRKGIMRLWVIWAGTSNMRTLIGAAALSLMVAAAVPALADTKAGADAWNRGDYPTAVAEWRKAAIAGDADAQFDLAQAYKLGAACRSTCRSRKAGT